MTQSIIVCPNCGEEIEEVSETFTGSDTYKYENGRYVKVPNGTIENYAIRHKRCGHALPIEIANKITSLLKE